MGYHAFTEDTDLYAVLEDGVKLTFHYPDFTDSYYVLKGASVGVESARLSDEQISYSWSSEPNGGGRIYKYSAGPVYRFYDDTDLYPRWLDIVTVSYYDGQTVVEAQDFEVGDTHEVLGTVDQMDAVIAWTVGSPDGQTRYQPGQKITVEGDIALYAVKADESVTLTYQVNGRESCSWSRKAAANEPVVLSDDAYDVELRIVPPFGMALLGWSTVENGTVIDWNAARFSQDTTLYTVFATAAVVTYDPNGGIGGGSYKHAIGRTLRNFTAADGFVTREGYTLKGWSLSKDGAELYDFSKPITGHTTLYAVWEAEKYIVAFDDVRNGSLSITVNGQPIENRSEVAVGSLVTVTVTGDEGYGTISSYWGWNEAETYARHELAVAETTPGTFTFTMPAGYVYASMTLYPTNAVKLTQHITVDGVEQTEVLYAPYDAPMSITMETQPGTIAKGKKLTGWAVGSPAGEKLTEGYYTFTEDTDLYAVIEDGVKLTWHYSDRDVSYYVTKGDLTAIEYVGVMDGKYLIRWSSEPDGGGTIYDSRAGFVYRFYEDTEFYPVYMDYVTLTIHDGEQTFERSIGTEEAFTVWSTGLTSNPVAYWAVGSADSETRYLPGQTVYFETDTDLYAGPAADMVTLKLYNAGHYPDMYYVEAAVKNEEKLLPDYNHDGENLIEPPFGKAFLGWSKTPDGDLIGQTASFSEDTDLYAVYAPAALVVYDANGGEYERRLNGRYKYAIGRCLTEYTAADGFVTREGYTLKGWSLSKDGAELYDFSKPITGHTTLYAVWEAEEPADVVISDTNSDSGVTVTLPNGAQVQGVALVAVPLAGEDNSVALAVLGKQLGQTAGKSYVLDIYFTKAGEEVSVEGRRTVTVPIPENWNAANTVVYYIDPDKGTVQNMNAVVSADGKTISFVTDHFSYYALVEVKAADANPTPAPTPAATAAPTTAPTAAPASSGAQIVKTGDAAMPILWLALGLSAALALGYVCLRKKEN